MSRHLAIFAFFAIFGVLTAFYLLPGSPYDQLPQVVETEPKDLGAASTFSSPSPVAPPKAEYITSYPCDCEGDRLLYYTDPWLRGSEVVELQKLLQSFGEYQGGIDGVFGPQTAAAVQNYKSKHGLPADSRVDLATWRSLADASLPVGREKTLPPPGKVRIKIDIYARRLTVYSDETPYKVYPVAVGKPETPTPLGYFRIVSKEWWGEGFGTRWMQLDTKFGKYGIHGTNKPWSIGSFASHGCIRMHNRHVEELFEWVKVGTPVYITKGPWGELGGRPLLKRGGLKGSPVMVVQRRLKQLGYYDIGVDGIYGFGTQQAVKKFQEDHGLNPTGVVDTATWDALGLFYFE